MADSLQRQFKVEPVADLYDAGRCNDVIDSLVSLESQVEQGQDRLIIGHVGRLEDRAGRLVLFWVEVLPALEYQTLSGDVVEVTETDAGATFETLLHQTRTNTIGAACNSQSVWLEYQSGVTKPTGDEHHLPLEGVGGNLGNVLRHQGRIRGWSRKGRLTCGSRGSSSKVKEKSV